jgi:hypothetical protein
MLMLFTSRAISDVKREDKMQEKISLLKPCNITESAIKGIQTEIENVTKRLKSISKQSIVILMQHQILSLVCKKLLLMLHV